MCTFLQELLQLSLQQIFTQNYIIKICSITVIVINQLMEKSLESEYKSIQNVETTTRNLVKNYNIHDKLIIIN